MISAFNSALTALQSIGTRINSGANNVANANTEGFKRTRVHLASVEPQGVKAEVERMETPGTQIYEETNNGLELIEQSNVDLTNELPQMMLDVNHYKANLKTIQATDEMFSSLLDTKA